MKMAVFSKGFIDGTKKFLQVDDWANVLKSNKAFNPIKAEIGFKADDAAAAARKAYKKGGHKLANKLSSNDAINPITNHGMMSGIPKTIYNMRVDKMDMFEAVKKAHMKDGKANYAAIAGSYMGVSVGARVLSGGGIHRDSDGRSNIIGLPFI